MAKKLSAGRATASAISTSSVAGIEVCPDPAPPPRLAVAMHLLVGYVAGSSTPRDGPAGRMSRVTREQEEFQELARSGLRQGARLERLPSGRPTFIGAPGGKRRVSTPPRRPTCQLSFSATSRVSGFGAHTSPRFAVDDARRRRATGTSGARVPRSRHPRRAVGHARFGLRRGHRFLGQDGG